MFNALRYTEELEKAGFTRNQAETSIKMLIDLMNENFATKTDLTITEKALRSDMMAMENAIRSDMNAMRNSIRSDMTEIRSDMKELEYKLTIKLGTMMTIAIGVTATLVKLIPSHG